MLPLCGHQVVAIADTGRELVEHCRSLKPDLVITDIKMPDMDGIEAAEEMPRAADPDHSGFRARRERLILNGRKRITSWRIS